MADSSFDIVSKVDRQEVDNAVNQAAKEIAQRYDFKNVGASVDAGRRGRDRHDGQLRGAGQGGPRRPADQAHQAAASRSRRWTPATASRRPPARSTGSSAPSRRGWARTNAKKITKLIRDEGPKGVKAQITGDEVRVTSKSRDDLQEVIALLKGADDIDAALQFVNYR